MQDSEIISSPRSTRSRWIIVATLFLVHFVNFWDKQVVGLAAPALMAEFHMSPRVYGLLTAGFFVLYGVGGIAVALVAAPRWRPRTIMAALLLIWSLLQLPIVLAASFPTLILCRMLLGLSEGAGAPTALNAAHEWFDEKSRDVPSAIILFGATAGSLVAAPILTAVILDYGWRAAFLLCGALGFLVLILWHMVGGDGPYAAERTSVEKSHAVVAIPQMPFLRDSTLLGNLVIGSCAYCMTGFAVGWLPLYLGIVTGSPIRGAWMMSTTLAFQAFIVLVIPILSQKLMKRGINSRRARGWTMATCMLISGFAFAAAAATAGPAAKLILLAVAVGFPAAVFPISAAMISEVAPPLHRNTAVTMILAAITIPVIFASMGTGWLVGAAGWTTVLVLYGLIMLVGAAAGYLLLHPEKSIERFTLSSPS